MNIKTLLIPFLATLMGSAHAAEPLTVRIGAPDQSAGPLPFIQGSLGLAHIQKQLEQALAVDGVQVQWVFFKGAGPAVNEAFANKQLDFAWLGDLAAIIGRANGLQTRWLFGARGASMYLAARPGLQVNGLDDLKGKRIAVYRGTADQLSFARLLASQNIKERDLQIVSLDWSAARAALVAGQVDVNWSGSGILALGSKGVTFPLSTKQLTPAATTQAGLVATQAFIDEHPQVTQHLVDVLVKNAAWLSDPQHLPEYSTLMAGQSNIPAELFTKELQGDDLKFRQSPLADPFLRGSLQDSVEQAKALGLVRRTFDAAGWLEPTFVGNAIEQQKLQGFWPEYDLNGKAL
jgi:sulfonate transport system substrate-binding protein